MEPFELSELLGLSMTPEELRHIEDAYADAIRRIEESVTSYRFLDQVLYDTHRLPSEQMMAVIIAAQYTKVMVEYNGNDAVLPMVFAILTTREMRGRG